MTQKENISHINYALVEDTRPPMYTAMKYWGKKPHNIWSEFIEHYCPENGVVLDPFAGSGVAAFEAIKLGRRAIAFDLNPFTTFLIEVMTSNFDEQAFVQAYDKIYSRIENDDVYKEHYTKRYEGNIGVIYNYRWTANVLTQLAIEIPQPSNKKAKRYLVDVDSEDKEKARRMDTIEIAYWFPRDRFPDTPSISHNLIVNAGGDGFQYLWTRRNLYILSRIFHEILEQENRSVRLQLLFGFVQTLHLTSKMVVPRHSAAKRDFSGSWGRADYMIRRRQMEQNPLIAFRRSCIERQSVLSAMRDAKNSLPQNLKIIDFNKNRKIQKADLVYGILDVADLTKSLQDKSIDFIITDPPYAGLVPYLDLSLIWLVWLQKIDKKYMPELRAEITIKKGQIGRDEYRRRLQNAFKQLHRVLKDNGYIVITFHHKKIQEWNDFVRAVRLAGFKFDKVTHQYNKRSGESNVANPYGTSGADFYIRCVKHRQIDFSDDISGLTHFIVRKTIEIISLRNEPTPYEFIIAGLVPEMLQAGYMQPQEYHDEIHRILTENSGDDKIFKTWQNTDNKSGDYWWFTHPEQHINFPNRPLQDRVEETVLSILRRKLSVTFDDILGELFRTYPNGLTPDPKGIKRILEKYAYKSASYWKIKDTVVQDSSKHTEIIKLLVKMGQRSKQLVFVGKREQPEYCRNGKQLKEIADIHSLDMLSETYHPDQIKRVEMVDVVWLNKVNEIWAVECVFEVENSTRFSSAIMRGSNIGETVPKFMVIPEERETELRNMRDPLFLDSFRKNNWHYVTYGPIKRLSGSSYPSLDEVIRISRRL